MAENHCPPHFLHPTNQIFQQINYNNFQIPNNVPQQVIAVDNQITQLGFGHFYHHDQEEQQQRRVWVDQQISNSAPSLSSLPSFPVNFGVGQNGDYGKVRGVLGEEEDGALMRGSEQFVLEGRSGNLTVPNCWRNQGDSPIKQAPPFGRPLRTEHLNENNKRSFEEVEETKEEVHDQNQNKRFKHSETFGNVLENNCSRQLVGNAEATYEGNFIIDKTNETCQESVQDQLKAINSSDEKEEKLTDVKNEKDSDTPLESSMVDFFNTLMNRLLHHQESLHQRFLKTIERLDEERKEREEAWRKQELARLKQQEIDKANAQALASTREAAILSYLEKITGQSIMIPRNTQEKYAQEVISSAEAMNVNRRWPKIEVEALIKIRTSLEPKFHDLALKAFVWEEISKLMGSMGYRRSAQRCKEKWENINRYYKKAREQNPQKRKTCPYFQQLDQFYSSKSFTNVSPSSSSSFCSMLHGRNLVPFGIVEEIPEKNEDDEEEEEKEEEEEGSDADYVLRNP